MQIVIDIPEELYDRLIIKGKDISEEETSTILDIIADGTVLPKGHGRLIDADNMKRIDAIQMGDFNSIESIRKWIDIMPIVIEADKEVDL